MTQASSGDDEQPRLKAGMRPWAPPSTSSVLAAIESPQEDAPFVFHDPAGRRWSRIKRGAVVAAAALVVVGSGVVVALTRVAPGRAPVFAGTPTQQVPDWQVRDPNAGQSSAPTAVPTAAQGRSASVPTARSTPAPTVRPTSTPRPSPTPTKRPTPTPKHTP